MGEQKAAEKPAGGPSGEKKPSSLRARVDRVRRSRERKFNFGRFVIALVALAITGLVIWLIARRA